MERQNFKPGAMTAPLPAVLVTVGEPGKANIITVAWTGILNTNPPKTYVSVRPTRHSHDILAAGREFVINLPTSRMVREVDYCGIFTGKKVNKFEKCHFTEGKSAVVAPPTIAECPLSLECRVTDIIPLGSHDMFVADIVNISVSPEILDADGRICLDRAGLMAYCHGEYFELGKKIGKFGFSATKKKPGGKAQNGGKAPKANRREKSGAGGKAGNGGKVQIGGKAQSGGKAQIGGKVAEAAKSRGNTNERKKRK